VLNGFARFGALFKGMSVSAIMYADDIVLLSPSVTELQEMLDYFNRELSWLDLKINVKKSNAIRIGNRHYSKCVNLCVNETIPWTKDAKYLGVTILLGNRFKCSFDKCKIKYYRTANAILAKIGNLSNKPVTMKLISTIALPILTYSVEALSLNKTELISLNHPWIRSFEKLFNTFDVNIVKQCMIYLDFLPISYQYIIKSMSFLSKLAASPSVLIQVIAECSMHEDIYRLCRLCDDKCSVDSFISNYLIILYEHFTNN
jgi:hypothetical protein